MALQSWNNLVTYIKSGLGAPHNQIELSDNDIITYIQEHVLPAFSQIVPNPRWIALTTQDLDYNSEVGKYNEYSYTLPETDEFDVCSIQEVYYVNSSINSIMAMASGYYQCFSPVDVALNNAYTDIYSSLEMGQSFRFVPPNKVIFSRSLENTNYNYTILELNTVHKRLDSIPPDVYQKIFKSLCMLEIYKKILAIRMKYNVLSTPFGEIGLNTSYLEAQIQALQTIVDDYQDRIPPKHLVAWL